MARSADGGIGCGDGGKTGVSEQGRLTAYEPSRVARRHLPKLIYLGWTDGNARPGVDAPIEKIEKTRDADLAQRQAIWDACMASGKRKAWDHGVGLKRQWIWRAMAIAETTRFRP